MRSCLTSAPVDLANQQAAGGPFETVFHPHLSLLTITSETVCIRTTPLVLSYQLLIHWTEWNLEKLSNVFWEQRDENIPDTK